MRYKAVVAYDGSNFSGWQKQLNANSVQETIETCLKKITGKETEITASGRTDAKVHAKGQVFHFDCEMETINANGFQNALNAMLPTSIRIQSVKEVDSEFHARFHASGKRYEFLVTQDIENPFIYNYMAKEKNKLDIAYMQECAKVFLGEHDFTTFTSSKIDPRKPRVKRITKLDIIEENDYIKMIFEGNGFLRYMVRMLAQTLIEAGKHKLDKDKIQKMLDGKSKHLCRYKAQPEGLYLVEVYYDD